MPELTDLQTIGGLSVVVTLVFEVIKRAWHPTAAQLSRFGALVAVGLGVAAAEAAAFVTGADLAQAALTGIFAGGLASGIYSLAQASPLPTYSPSSAGLP